jgi:hypothetical protein
MHHFPPPPADASLTERFAWLVKTIVMRVELFVRWEPATEPVRDAIKVRLRRALDRFASLLAQFEAGTLQPPRPRPARPRPDPAEGEARPPRRPGTRLPRHLGWLLELTGDSEITGLGLGLDDMVRNDAGMRALIAASPRAAALVRSILWMTGMQQIPEILAPPPDPLATMRRWEAAWARQYPPQQPPPEPPPPFFAALMPTPEQQEAEARRYANRPGGLFWDGKRFFYS